MKFFATLFILLAVSQLSLPIASALKPFNSKIKEDDFVYLLIEFLIKDYQYPVYIDIRYIYNGITFSKLHINITGY